jgi:circadian clock protein KaiC
MKKQNAKQPPQLPKSPTGIPGMDELTGGGLPKGRSTLICGGAGDGKTLMVNFASLGYDLQPQPPGDTDATGT